MTESADDAITRFADVLNRQGFPFHYAALNTAGEFFETRKSRWFFQVAEFPVAVGGKDTRIDFILRKDKSPFLLCVECKRADPERKHWCFLKAPYVHRNCDYDRITADQLAFNPAGDWRIRAVELQGLSTLAKYHIGLQVRTRGPRGEKDREPGQPLAADEAVGQACKGANGLLEFLLNNPSCMGQYKGAVVVPAVFTTARLWTSEVSLKDADVFEGEVEKDACALNPSDFLIYQYHLPTGIKQTLSRDTGFRDLADALASQYIRSVPIVSAAGIGSFLRLFDPEVGNLTPIIPEQHRTFVE